MIKSHIHKIAASITKTERGGVEPPTTPFLGNTIAVKATNMAYFFRALPTELPLVSHFFVTVSTIKILLYTQSFSLK